MGTCLFVPGQLNNETAAFSQPAFNRNMAAMGLGNVFDDGQPQTGSPHVAAAGFVHPVEALKETRQMLLGNTDTVVLNADDDIGILPK